MEQVAELSAQWEWVQVFENKGAVMGCSNPHPHGQLWGSDFLPNEIAREEQHQRDWLAEHGRPLLVDYVERELKDRSRIVVETAHWLAVVPFWAAWPFETLLLPKRHVPSLLDLTPELQQDLAIALKELTSRYDNLFECSFPTPWAGTLLRPAPTAQRRGNCMPTSIRRCCAPPRCANSWWASRCWPRPSVTLPRNKPRNGCGCFPHSLQPDQSGQRGGPMTPSQRVSAVFAEQFEQQPDLLVRAPRVNLIGEHTDYNDGFVLPCAIDYETCVAIGLRDDSLVHVIAADYGNQRDLFDLDQPIGHHADQRWSDYIRGVVKYLQERGYPLRGLNLVVSGNVPQGPASPLPPRWRWLSARLSRRHLGSPSRRPRLPSTASRRRTSSSAATAASWTR